MHPTITACIVIALVAIATTPFTLLDLRAAGHRSGGKVAREMDALLRGTIALMCHSTIAILAIGGALGSASVMSLAYITLGGGVGAFFGVLVVSFHGAYWSQRASMARQAARYRRELREATVEGAS
ncbi:hypothetical protein GCM10025867_46110 (plasmid) [Frondihabitans sucicola]|uniref:Uncharacterized protein n=1 Tax=Frondihabitans sucicola TaxID=1268041 RepID=A0ABN6Y8S2_9MICO|nr:hypothetical protein [Frondihabitans sucicola]BDZ52370.1 hypothetical protein GCM10025867_46110 [Frondihabitans sucicola]